MKVCNILGVNVAVTNMKEVLEYLRENLKDLKGKYICVSNVHTTVMAYEDSKYRNIQNSGIIALPDGGPLSFIQRNRGFSEAERITGPDLMEKVFEISEKYGYKHYFYGSSNETLQLMKKNLLEKYPKLKIVGMYSPPFRNVVELESDEVIENINNSGADFCWIGLGAPKQEQWMYYHRGKIKVLMLGVGAGFDYYAGNIKRAPKWMQKLSLEWLYRLMQDPKRLFKRYVVTNSKFIFINIFKRGKLN